AGIAVRRRLRKRALVVARATRGAAAKSPGSAQRHGALTTIADVTRALHVRRLGRVEYEDGLAMQKLLVEARARGLVPDTLLLLEHPPVITLGRGAKAHNVLWPSELLASRGFEVFETDRGGDVTYHGPGQIVGYPVVDLKPDRKDVRKYVASLEEIMIRVAGEYGIGAARVAGRTGVWTPAGKLGAIGVHISRWITSHGFAFNVRTDLADFSAIVPCGIQDASVASLQSLLGEAPPLHEVEDVFALKTAFAVRVEGEPTLSDEHDEHRWCTPEEALRLLPFAGLRRAVRVALVL